MTAPTATIIGPLTYPGTGRVVAARSVTVRCVGPDGAVLRDSDGGLVGETTVHTDDSGAFAVVLTLNSDIDEASGVGPPGTYWVCTVGVRPAVSWQCRLDVDAADQSIPIGDAAHTIVDPTPRGWTPLAGPTGPRGIPGIATGPLASRPATPAEPVAYIAPDASPAVSVWDGSAWSPVDTGGSRLVTSASDTTSGLTTTIAALNTHYRIGALETADVVWPGGVARVSLTGLTEPASAHVLGATDVLGVRRSTDSGATWTLIGYTVSFRQSVDTTRWIPETPLTVVSDMLTAGTTVRWRVTLTRLFTGSAPVTVSWVNDTRHLVIEALR